MKFKQFWKGLDPNEKRTFANAIGKKNQYCSNIASGARSPSPKMAKKMSDATGGCVSFSSFFCQDLQGSSRHSFLTTPKEANDAGTVGSGHRNEALATGDLQPNKTSRVTPPESQGQPQVCAVRRRRRVPSSNPSSPRGGGTSAPNDAGVNS